MTTQNLNLNSQLTAFLTKNCATHVGTFSLIDVGCSGGLHGMWSPFSDHFRAAAFDPLVPEIEKLRAENKHAGVKYECAFVGSKNYAQLLSDDDKAKLPSTDFTMRTSSLRAQKGDTQNYQQEHFNSGKPLEFAKEKIGLDEYCQKNNFGPVDFLKVDTDGHDYDVLLSADKLLSEDVIGASVEAPFQGPVHEHANVFCNIDRFMRSKGFTLCDLDAFRYARGDLPLPFYYDIPAQTRAGALLWGEAVYFRDLADPDYEKKWGYKPTPASYFKLACLYDLFGMPDCAAELIRSQPRIFDGISEVCLNLLVPPMITGQLPYRDYMGVFDMHPELWYPKNKLFQRVG